MKIFANTTSPFARLAAIVMAEKGIARPDAAMVNPWADPPDLLAVNSAARVPTIVTDDGKRLTESLLIVLRLEHTHPEPSVIAGDVDAILQRAGIAYGVIEAAVHIMVGRVIINGSITAKDFDETPVGLRRRRSILTGLDRLEADPPVYTGGIPDLAMITAVIALDYVQFRFGESNWLKPFPTLQRLADELNARPSFETTVPTA